jgi:hypothetical protein
MGTASCRARLLIVSPTPISTMASSAAIIEAVIYVPYIVEKIQLL